VYFFQLRDAQMPNVAEIIKAHVTLEVRGFDRLYLNAYVPRLQKSGGVIDFSCGHQKKVPSPAMFGEITTAFKTAQRTWPAQPVIPRSNSVKANAST
jgi:hypothetical protein